MGLVIRMGLSECPYQNLSFTRIHGTLLITRIEILTSIDDKIYYETEHFHWNIYQYEGTS